MEAPCDKRSSRSDAASEEFYNLVGEVTFYGFAGGELSEMKRRMQRKSAAAGVFLVITFGMGMFWLNICGPRSDQGVAPVGIAPPGHETGVPRVAAIGPILIDGDGVSNRWEDCLWVNGSGTFEDPYRLENLTIDGRGSPYGIRIQDSQAYFRVWNCSFVPAYGTIGLDIYDVHNGTISQNNCSHHATGIYARIISNLTFHENNLSSTAVGLNLATCENSSIIGNYGQNFTMRALEIAYSQEVTVIENRFSEGRNDKFIYVKDSNKINIEGNNCSYGVFGIYLRHVNDTRVVYNNCSFNNMTGVEIYEYTSSLNINITRNWFHRNDGGAIVDPGVYAAAYDNYIIGTLWAGIWTHAASVLGEVLVLNDSTSGGEGLIQHEWDFGDGTPNATTASVAHQYAAAGSYNVTHRVTDSAGYSSTTNRTVEILGPGWHIYRTPTPYLEYKEWIRAASGALVTHISLEVRDPVQVGVWVNATSPVGLVPANTQDDHHVFITITMNNTYYSFFAFSLTAGYTGQEIDPSSARLWLYDPDANQWKQVEAKIYKTASGFGDTEWNATFILDNMLFDTPSLTDYLCVTFGPPFRLEWWAYVAIAGSVAYVVTVVARRHKAGAKAKAGAAATKVDPTKPDLEWDAMDKE